MLHAQERFQQAEMAADDGRARPRPVLAWDREFSGIRVHIEVVGSLWFTDDDGRREVPWLLDIPASTLRVNAGDGQHLLTRLADGLLSCSERYRAYASRRRRPAAKKRTAA